MCTGTVFRRAAGCSKTCSERVSFPLFFFPFFLLVESPDGLRSIGFPRLENNYVSGACTLLANVSLMLNLFAVETHFLAMTKISGHQFLLN